MKTKKNLPGSTLFVFSVMILSITSAAAKVRPIAPVKAKPIEVNSIKDINGEASLQAQQSIQLPINSNLLQFQDGKQTDSIEFHKSPRCYLHFRKDIQSAKQVDSGQVLQVSKIDNIYANGAVHVTFWFDKDPTVSDLACITNYDHTITLSELKNTLGNLFQVSFTQSVETNALFNTFPNKNVKTLSEESLSSGPTYSYRIILTDS